MDDTSSYTDYPAVQAALVKMVQTEAGAMKVVEAMRRPLEMRLEYLSAMQYAFNPSVTPLEGDDLKVARHFCNPEIPLSILLGGRVDLLDRARDLTLSQLLANMTETLVATLESRAVTVKDLPKPDKNPIPKGVYLCGPVAAAQIRTVSPWGSPETTAARMAGVLGESNGWKLVMSRFLPPNVAYMLQPLGDQHLKVETKLSKYGDLFGIQVTCVVTTKYNPEWTALKWVLPERK